MHGRSGWILAAMILVWILPAGCGDEKKATKPEATPPDRVPDFSIVDVNPNSSAYGDSISPRDYLGKVSCWYFGHST